MSSSKLPGIIYTYNVKIELTHSSALRSSLAKSLDGGMEVMLDSKRYDQYANCVKDVNRLLADLADEYASLTERKFTVTWIPNPALHREGDNLPKSQMTDWIDGEVIRLYVVDVEKMKAKSHESILVNASIFSTRPMPYDPSKSSH